MFFRARYESHENRRPTQVATRLPYREGNLFNDLPSPRELKRVTKRISRMRARCLRSPRPVAIPKLRSGIRHCLALAAAPPHCGFGPLTLGGRSSRCLCSSCCSFDPAGHSPSRAGAGTTADFDVLPASASSRKDGGREAEPGRSGRRHAPGLDPRRVRRNPIESAHRTERPLFGEFRT
jgi:hypothetical protein